MRCCAVWPACAPTRPRPAFSPRRPVRTRTAARDRMPGSGRRVRGGHVRPGGRGDRHCGLDRGRGHDSTMVAGEMARLVMCELVSRVSAGGLAQGVVAQALVQDGAVHSHGPAGLAQVVRGPPGPGHVQRQLHDPLDRAVQLVQRLRQAPPELLPVQRQVLGDRARFAVAGAGLVSSAAPVGPVQEVVPASEGAPGSDHVRRAAAGQASRPLPPVRRSRPRCRRSVLLGRRSSAVPARPVSGRPAG